MIDEEENAIDYGIITNYLFILFAIYERHLNIRRISLNAEQAMIDEGENAVEE